MISYCQLMMMMMMMMADFTHTFLVPIPHTKFITWCHVTNR